MPYCTPRHPPNNNHPPLPPVYLVQGLLGLSRLAVFTFFKDDLALDPASVGFLTGLGFAPWVIKPLYGFLSDTVPLFGYRRRSYLILCGILGARPGGHAGRAPLDPARPPALGRSSSGRVRARRWAPHAQVYSSARPWPRGGCNFTRTTARKPPTWPPGLHPSMQAPPPGPCWPLLPAAPAQRWHSSFWALRPRPAPTWWQTR